MANDSGQSYEQGARVARTAADKGRQAARTGRRAARGIGRAAKNGAAAGIFSTATAKIIAIILVALIVILFLSEVITGGTSSSSMDPTYFLTAKDADTVNAPETDEEISSTYTKVQSLDQTARLAAVIQQARTADRDRIEARLRKQFNTDGDITFECDTDTAPVYVCDDIDGLGTPYAGNPGSAVMTLNPDEFYGKDIKVGQAMSGEHGIKDCGNKPGDQTGNEVTEKTGYNTGGPWEYAIRAKDDKTKILIADAMRKACKNDNIGYDQGNSATGYTDRGTCYAEAEKVSWDLSRITNKCETSCSDLASVCLRAAGVSKKYAPQYNYTGNFWSQLQGSGLFTKISLDASKALPGDILIAPGRHMGIVTQSPNRITLPASELMGPAGSSAGALAVAWGKQQLNKGWKYVEYDTVPDAACPICHPEKNSKGWQCIGFITACYFHGAGVRTNIHKRSSKTECTLEGLGNGGTGASNNSKKNTLEGYSPEDVYKKWKRRNGKDWTMITCGSLTSGQVRESELQPGDILLNYTSAGWNRHTSMYIGDGECIECTGGAGVQTYKFSSRHSARIAMRYTGAATGGDGIVATEGTYFSPQNGFTELGQISADTGKRVSLAHPPGKPVAQSFAYTGGTYAVAFTDGPHTKVTGIVRSFNADGSVVSGSDASESIYHANGSCTTADGSFIVAGSLTSNNARAVIFKQDNGKLSVSETTDLPRNASAIAYDRETGNYILSVSNEMTVYDGEMKEGLKKVDRNMHGQYWQDIGAGCGSIFACHTNHPKSAGINYIDIYNESTGDYCGSYKLTYGELESADVVDNKLVLLVHIKGSDDNYIHFTDITVGGGTGQNLKGMVSESDLDILSAYSISLANSELSFVRKNEKTKQEDGTILSTRYTDINGKPIKTYWFGKDKGKINYEGDLKKKVKRWTFYDRADYEIDRSGHTVKITLKELPAHKVCSRFFGLDPKAEYVNALAKPGSEETAEEEASDADEDEPDYKGPTKEERKKWYLLLVNEDHAIPDGYSVSTKALDPSFTTGTEESSSIDSRIAARLTEMLSDCKAAGNDPVVCSAYRTRASQEVIYNREASGTAAKPGHSEHECGLCADIIDRESLEWDDPLTDLQEDTPAQKWLMAHCAEYGFILRYPEGMDDATGIEYEPWHYRFVGKKHAKAIMDNNLCLEEYLEHKKGRDDGYSGRTTNAHAIYTLSENTASLLYTGLVERPKLGQGALPGGQWLFPLPEGTWEQTDGFGTYDPCRNGRAHHGVDLGAPKGTPILSATDGEVIDASFDEGYGNHVVIEYGSYKIFYGHMSSISVSKGPVMRGTKLGEVGNTGHSFGDHLHFEVRLHDKPIEPAPFLGNGVLTGPEYEKAHPN